MRLTSPFEILDQLRSRPIEPSEAIENLQISAMAGSVRARRRLTEMATDMNLSFLTRLAAQRAARKLYVTFGAIEEGKTNGCP